MRTDTDLFQLRARLASGVVAAGIVAGSVAFATPAFATETETETLAPTATAEETNAPAVDGKTTNTPVPDLSEVCDVDEWIKSDRGGDFMDASDRHEFATNEIKWEEFSKGEGLRVAMNVQIIKQKVSDLEAAQWRAWLVGAPNTDPFELEVAGSGAQTFTIPVDAEEPYHNVYLKPKAGAVIPELQEGNTYRVIIGRADKKPCDEGFTVDDVQLKITDGIRRASSFTVEKSRYTQTESIPGVVWTLEGLTKNATVKISIKKPDNSVEVIADDYTANAEGRLTNAIVYSEEVTDIKKPWIIGDYVIIAEDEYGYKYEVPFSVVADDAAAPAPSQTTDSNVEQVSTGSNNNSSSGLASTGSEIDAFGPAGLALVGVIAGAGLIAARRFRADA